MPQPVIAWIEPRSQPSGYNKKAQRLLQPPGIMTRMISRESVGLPEKKPYECLSNLLSAMAGNSKTLAVLVIHQPSQLVDPIHERIQNIEAEEKEKNQARENSMKLLSASLVHPANVLFNLTCPFPPSAG